MYKDVYHQTKEDGVGMGEKECTQGFAGLARRKEGCLGDPGIGGRM